MRAMDFTAEQLEVLLLYAGRVITRKRAAKLLGGVSERHVNRYLRMAKIDRSMSETREGRDQASKKRQAREQAARAAREGKITVEQAAARAGCSVRTVYRYMDRVK